MPDFSHETYLSPYTWRYGTDEMRRVWSLVHKRRTWRRLWVALAEAQQAAGLVSAEQVADLRAHQDEVDIDRAHELERDLRHDLMAEVHTYAEQCTVGGGIIHLGATSMDIEDNADALRLREALSLVVAGLGEALGLLAEQMETYAATPCVGFTHIQPAEPTTIGYRMAFYAQDLLADYETLRRLRDGVRGKGFKGAVGTMASYAQLLEGTGVTPEAFELDVMGRVGLEAFPVAHQTYPRRQDWEIVSALAGVGLTAHKFAFDLRLLQSPVMGEWHEPFGAKQIGSSAMPFKRNPVDAENMNSLARLLAGLPRVMWDNAANSLLERTLDDSGNRRTVIPEAFLISDELLKRLKRLLRGLTVAEDVIARNFEQYAVFAASERLLMAASRAGGNRQELREVIREHSLTAWDALRRGEPNPLADLLTADERLTGNIGAEAARALLVADDYVGIAPERARETAARVRKVVEMGA